MEKAGGGDETVDLCCLEIACCLMRTGSAILLAGYGRCLVILQYSHSQNTALIQYISHRNLLLLGRNRQQKECIELRSQLKEIALLYYELHG